MTAVLQVKDLKAYYGQTQALHGVSFALEQGGITTLLGAMAVLLAIAAGSVLGEFLAAPFDRSAVQKRRARRR